MTYTVTIETDNDAFQGDANAEIARILDGLATRLVAESNQTPAVALYDINGNKVGEAGEAEAPRVIVSSDDCGNIWVNSDKELNIDIIPEWESDKDAYDAEDIARFEALDEEFGTLEYGY